MKFNTILLQYSFIKMTESTEAFLLFLKDYLNVSKSFSQKLHRNILPFMSEYFFLTLGNGFIEMFLHLSRCLGENA